MIAEVLTRPPRAFPAEAVGPVSPAPFGLERDRELSVLGTAPAVPEDLSRVLKVDFSGRASASDPAGERRRRVDVERVAGLIAQARSLVEVAPDSPMASARLAATLLGSGNPKEAVAAARSALEMSATAGTDSPPDMPAVVTAARVLGDQELHDEIEDFLARLRIGSRPTLVGSCLWASVAASQQKFELALVRLQGLEEPEVRALRGYLLLEVGQFQQALRELRAARHVLEDTRSLLGNIAYAYAALGSLRKAVKTARQAWLLAPESLRAALDLAFYLTASGLAQEAFAHLTAWQKTHGRRQDAQALLVPKVNALLALGDIAAARRELQAARTSRTVSADPIARAEIVGNLEYIRWQMGEISRATLLERIRKALVSCGNRSIGLATMLADVVRSTSAHAEVARLYEDLLPRHGERNLLPLRTRVCALACDFEGQLRAADQWHRAWPLDAEPQTMIVFLRGTLFGDHKSAAKMGEQAVRRFPTSSMLRNNAAYEMVLAGEYAKAHRMLRQAPKDDPYIIATRGLLRIVTGDVDGGIDDYRSAISRGVQLASDPDGADEFRCHVAVELRLLSRQAAVPDRVLSAFPFLGLPPAWRSLRGWCALEARARRLGVEWPPSS